MSSSFIERPWPEKELNAALNIEASSGDIKVLPLLIGTKDDNQRVLKQYPLLNDKRYLTWPHDKEQLESDILALIRRPTDKGEQKKIAREIPIPKIRRQPTDLERHKFLK